MYKEIIISVIVVAVIVVGNILTQGYTRKSAEETNKQLEELRQDLRKEEKEGEKLQKTIGRIHQEWDNRYSILAYFIEHDELEKVETQLTAVKANIEIEEYEQSIPELDKCIYLLNHVKDKEALMIQNIF